jgi:hypothetical protein
LHHFDFLLVVLSEPLMRTRRFMRHWLLTICQFYLFIVLLPVRW